MNISISIKDLISIASSDNLAACGCITKYPEVIYALKKIDPLASECVVVEEFGQVWVYHPQEYIDYRKRMEAMDKEPIPVPIEPTTEVDGFSPEVLEQIRKINPSIIEMLKL